MKLILPVITIVLELSKPVTSHGATSIPPSRQFLCSGGATPNLGVYWNGGNGPNICKPSSHSNNANYNINNVIVDWMSVAQLPEGWKTNPEYAQDPRTAHINVMGNGLDSTVCSGERDRYEALNNPKLHTN